jgi:uncharacterized SAM-binding protein YcdF (DUF218 family)
MAFWNRKKNWEDEYDEYYAQDRRAEPGKKPGRLRFLPHLLLLAFLGALFVGGIGLVSGPTMVEKLLTVLVTPVGFVWLGLMLLIYFSVMTRQGWPAVAGLVCWLILTIGGNQLVSQWLAGSLEAPYQDLDVFEVEPFDMIVVLGGGTSSTLDGQSQLSIDGDRVAIAARLFHAGQVKRFVCTGTQAFRSTPKDLDPRQEATEILVGLNVPKSAILQMRGENTSQEMANLKTWLAENKVGGRVGILTSAWHLSRAIRLAEAQGLTVHPVPSNFVTAPYTPSPHLVVPGADHLMITSKMLKEYLARLIGR